MLLFINRYLRRPSKDKDTGRNKGHGEKKIEMQSLCASETSHACAHGCLTAPFLSLMEARNPRQQQQTTTLTTTRISRSNFAKSTTSSLFPNTYFTNHESLPPLPDAFSNFSAAYPQYSETQQADHIREREYYHLVNHVCLDYTGFNLFSHAQMHSSIASSSSDPPPSRALLQPPFFNISYKSASLKSHVQYGNRETALESAIRKRITNVLNISDEEYSMVCTANRSTAFRLLAESYPFHTNKRLLTVYDYESEAVSALAESAQKKGAKVISASFTWPSLRIHSARLRKKVSKKRKKKRRGLFVFPLQSRMTGARYPYLWMALAQENGWHVVLDACALGPKDMDTLGLSLIKPDFIICSFFKVFGENPAGFAGLFIKKSSSAVLEASTIAKSIGIVSIVPARSLSRLPTDYSGTDLEEAQSSKFQLEEEEDAETTSSFSGPIPPRTCNGSFHPDDGLAENPSSVEQIQIKRPEQGETSETRRPIVSKDEEKADPSPEIVEVESDNNSVQAERTETNREGDKSMKIECRGLDHADSLGLLLISSRLRCITNWLVIALMKLQHPHSENGHALVRIYGPRIKFDRGPALAFNVFDWKGEKVDPALVQKLADRSNVSLSCGFIRNIWFSDKYEGAKDAVLERRVSETTVASKRKENIDLGINVVNASLGYLTNFEDAYKLWAFIAKFLDADFVEKERWRYMALNQKMIEI